LTRPTAVSFKNEDDFDPVRDAEAMEDEDADMDSENDNGAEMLNRFLSEYKKRQAKKKKALYASARRAAKYLAREGMACLEEGKAKILALKKEETEADKYAKDITPLWTNLEDSVGALLSTYLTGFEDLFLRRLNTVDAASEMLRANPRTGADAHADCKDAADAQVEQSKEDEMVLSTKLQCRQQTLTIVLSSL
ncbi:hypothetical protein DFH08DRAFT_897235, partial [Mycena albidolilacea]